MERAKFYVALVVVLAGAYLWYVRGVTTRSHEVCLNATQELMEQQRARVRFDKVDDYYDYIDSYNNWYGHCRALRTARQFGGELVLNEETKRQDTE